MKPGRFISPLLAFAFAGRLAAGEIYPSSSAFPVSVSDSIGLHAYVDLGLSVRWATCNVGAGSADAEGMLFAWADSTSNTEFNWAAYLYSKDSSEWLLKYNPDSLAGVVDSLYTLSGVDDVASRAWGKDWRMPTDQEFLDLRDACVWLWVDNYNGTQQPGMLGVSRLNGNSIFLPATACFREDKEKEIWEGWYWSASLTPEDPTFAQQFFFPYGANGLDMGIVATPRCFGRFVRAVSVKK